MTDARTDGKTLSLAHAAEVAESHFQAGNWQGAEFIFTQLAQALPAITHSHARVIERLERLDDALAAYARWLALGQEPLPAAFDADYLAALRDTRNPILPLPRRRRFSRLGELFTEASGVDGAVAECGCFRGLSAYFLCAQERRRTPGYDGKDFFRFDSFAGLSLPTEEDRIADDLENADALRRMSHPGAFAASLADVREHLRDFPGVTLHPGWIPDAFEGLPERHYRFVNLDVDLFEPTHESLEYFYPRLAPGGLIVSDDYSWPGARRAREDYAARVAAPLETTPLGQAILRKSR
ncbi:MAG: TylF/MycF/NovP-related O-methyltransferase [Burkholderiales bacterium]